MANANLYPSSVAQDQENRHRKMVFEFTINGSATAANKTMVTDMPDTVYLRTQGLTTTVDGLDATPSWTTAADSSGTFGVLILASSLVSKSSAIAKVLKVSVQETSTAVTSNMTVTKHGTGGLSTNGNIAFSIVSNAALNTAITAKICAEVDFECEV